MSGDRRHAAGVFRKPLRDLYVAREDGRQFDEGTKSLRMDTNLETATPLAGKLRNRDRSR